MLISKLLLNVANKETDPALVTSASSIVAKKGTYKFILIGAGNNGNTGQQASQGNTTVRGGGGGGSGYVTIVTITTNGETFTFSPGTSPGAASTVSGSISGTIGTANGGSAGSVGGASGGAGGAGIGTGAAYKATATLGNITIKGGTVTANGGEHENALGIGTGFIYTNSNGHASIGAVTIYDTIDWVDISNIWSTITYMHGETDVTANASNYFNFAADGNRRMISSKSCGQDYPITIADDIEHGSLTGPATAKFLERVTMTPHPMKDMDSDN